jgi:hypothetical protein
MNAIPGCLRTVMILGMTRVFEGEELRTTFRRTSKVNPHRRGSPNSRGSVSDTIIRRISSDNYMRFRSFERRQLERTREVDWSCMCLSRPLHRPGERVPGQI